MLHTLAHILFILVVLSACAWLARAAWEINRCESTYCLGVALMLKNDCDAGDPPLGRLAGVCFGFSINK